MYGGGCFVPPGAMWTSQNHNGIVHHPYYVPGFSHQSDKSGLPDNSAHLFPVYSLPNQSSEGFISTTTSTNIPGLSESISIYTFGDKNSLTSVNYAPVISSAPTLRNDQLSQCTSVFSSSVRPKTTSGGQTVVAPSNVSNEPVSIVNSCLCFIRSQLYRLTNEEVIKSTTVNFGLQELKEARESLFRNTGTKNYKYMGPKNPSTQNDNSKFCVASIIAKIEELGKSGIVLKFVSSAEDLFRLSNMMSLRSSSEISEETSRKIQNLEKDVNYLKSLPHNMNPAAIPMPKLIYQNNRQSLINSLEFPALKTPTRSIPQIPNKVNSPSKRRRMSVTDKPTNSPLANENSQAWKTISKKRNRPEPEHVPKGRPPPESKSHEVFLFRYMEEETPSTILRYFKDVGVTSAHHVRYCCSPYSKSKNFVMKFKDINQFKLIVRNLPDFTGCRPYTADPPADIENRPRGYFNRGGRISGPDVEELLCDGDEEDSAEMDTSAIQTSSDLSVSTSTSAQSTANSGSFTRDTVAAAISESLSSIQTGGASDSSTNPASTTVSIVTATSASSTTTTSSASSPVSSVLDSIKPLDSPHLRTSSIGYESVVSDQ